MKKFLALLLALTLALSLSVTGFAAATQGSTATGEGDTEYIDAEILDLDLPTGNAFRFTLDPQGLSGLSGNGSALSSLDKGKILGGDPVKFVNNSSVPATLSVTLQLISTKATTGDDTTDVVFVDSTSAVTQDTAKNILFYVAPSKVNTATGAFTKTDEAFVVGTAAKTLEFLMPAADYLVKATTGAAKYEMNLVANSGHGSALQLGGLVNDKANWLALSDEDGAVALKVVFQAESNPAADLEAASYDTASAAYLLDASTDFPSNKRVPAEFKSGTPTPILYSGASGTTELASLSAVSAAVSFRIGNLTNKTANQLTSLKIGGVQVVNPNHYTVKVTDGLLHITFTASSTWFANSKTGTDTIEAVVDGQTYTFNVIM